MRWWFKSPSRQQHCGTCRITCLWISSEASGIAGWDAVGPSAVRFSPAQYGHGRSLARKCSNGAHFWTPLDFPELSFKWRARLSCPSPARIAASVRRGEGLPGIGRCWSAVQCTADSWQRRASPHRSRGRPLDWQFLRTSPYAPSKRLPRTNVFQSAGSITRPEFSATVNPAPQPLHNELRKRGSARRHPRVSRHVNHEHRAVPHRFAHHVIAS